MQIIRKLSVLLTVILLLTLQGCGDEGKPVYTAIVCGYHKNAPEPAFHAPEISSAIMDSVQSSGSVVIVVDDGAPFVAVNYDILPIERAGVQEKNVMDQYTAEILSVLAEAKAETPEVDTLKAIYFAARGIVDAPGIKRMYILDSGLSTTGYLNFTADLLQSDSDTLLHSIEEQDALPNLTGIEVIWIGLGDVKGEQEELSPQNRKQLETIWDKILTAAGAASVKFASTPTGDVAEDYNALPAVTPVTVPEPEPDRAPDATKVFFIKDTAKLSDSDTARDLLTPTVTYMKEHPTYRVVLAGTTATVGSNDNCKPLSLDRANAVRDLLEEMGVQPEQIIYTAGLGYTHAFHIEDVGPDGKLTAAAQENRAVIIVDANSEDAQYIISLSSNR